MIGICDDIRVTSAGDHSAAGKPQPNPAVDAGSALSLLLRTGAASDDGIRTRYKKASHHGGPRSATELPSLPAASAIIAAPWSSVALRGEKILALFMQDHGGSDVCR